MGDDSAQAKAVVGPFLIGAVRKAKLSNVS
jgi:hypothetical protein